MKLRHALCTGLHEHGLFQSGNTETFTDLGDVHDFDGRQLSRFDMSPLVRKSKERERLKRCN